MNWSVHIITVLLLLFPPPYLLLLLLFLHVFVGMAVYTYAGLWNCVGAVCHTGVLSAINLRVRSSQTELKHTPKLQYSLRRGNDV